MNKTSSDEKPADNSGFFIGDPKKNAHKKFKALIPNFQALTNHERADRTLYIAKKQAKYGWRSKKSMQYHLSSRLIMYDPDRSNSSHGNATSRTPKYRV